MLVPLLPLGKSTLLDLSVARFGPRDVLNIHIVLAGDETGLAERIRRCTFNVFRAKLVSLGRIVPFLVVAIGFLINILWMMSGLFDTAPVKDSKRLIVLSQLEAFLSSKIIR